VPPGSGQDRQEKTILWDENKPQKQTERTMLLLFSQMNPYERSSDSKISRIRNGVI
jgi:hypothetical protein